jgi:filamentous hemagglutinin
MSKSNSGYFKGTTGEGKTLVNKIIEKGYKICPSEVIGITQDANGKIVWLENGSKGAKPSGLYHILEAHESHFNQKGICTEDIADFVLTAVSKGEVIGYQGKGNGRPIYRVTYDGKEYNVAITIGSNGYIVGANPTSGGNIND